MKARYRIDEPTGNSYVDNYIKELKSNNIKDGDKIKIDVDSIMSRKGFNKMNLLYQNFIKKSKNKVFTARVTRQGFVELIEAPEWLFWKGELIPV